MQPSFNINRPPISDEEINKHKDFDSLVAQFKKQSLKKARGDESWWKNKKVQYSTVILGVTVVCTVTYQSIKRSPELSKATNDKIITSSKKNKNTTNTTAPEPVRFVQSRIAALDKKSSTYNVNNQKGAELLHPTTTKIKI